jgi:hypothetical protein
MKKLFLAVFLLAIVVTTTGCGGPAQMDKLDAGVYHYQNELLGFKLDLPKEFEYYQTQLVLGKNNLGQQMTDWSDIQILVPTNDLRYEKTARSYAVPVTVRVFTAGKYKDFPGFEKLNESQDRIYAIKFWDKVPSDWTGRWTVELGKQIKKSFRVQ